MMLKRLSFAMLASLVLLTVVFFAGPAHQVSAQLAPPVLPAAAAGPVALETWLAASEARHADLVPGAEKTIIWAHADRRRTPLSVIYLHGYTATRQEVAPLSDLFARELGANLFYTRLTGHGRSPAALGTADADDWLRDAAEALAIGRRLGERVLVVGTSTGGTLALWLAQRPGSESIAAQLLISPNLGPRDGKADLLAGPWGEQLQRALIGEEYRWQPANPRQAKYWTWRYPARALVPMMALVKEVRRSPLEAIEVPTLVVYSPLDQVVSPARIEEAYARLKMPARQLYPVAQSEDRAHHVLAGDILAPAGTAPLLATMLSFVSTLPPAQLGGGLQGDNEAR